MRISSKKYCIVGTGGFGREVLCCLIDYLASVESQVQGRVIFMVDDEYYQHTNIMGVPVIRRSEFDVSEYEVLVAVGDSSARKKMVNSLPPETQYGRLIHPTATVSEWVELGEGTIITAGCVVTCNIKLGAHTHLNLNTTIGHDCEIGDYFTTAPSVNISGSCSFGKCVYFGTSSSVRQGISICDNVTIGMGGVVVKDIVDEGVYIGSPVTKLIK